MAIDNSDYRRVFAADLTQTEKLLAEAKQHPNALKQYLRSWQEIAEKAAEVDNLALQDLVLLFVDALDSAFNQDDIAKLPDEQWQLLAEWQSLFTRYIQNPHQQDCALALINCLNNPVSAVELTPEDVQMLLDSFVPVIQQLQANHQNIVEAPPAEDSATFVTISLWSKIQPLFANTATDLQQAAIHSQDLINLEAALKVDLQQYLDDWLAVAQQIERSGEQLGLLDLVLLFIEVCRQIFEQPKNFDNNLQTVLNEWHSLFSGYFQTQDNLELASSLIKCLRNPIWPGAITAEDEKMLLEPFTATLAFPLESVEKSTVMESEVDAELEPTTHTETEFDSEYTSPVIAEFTDETSDLAELPELMLSEDAEPAIELTFEDEIANADMPETAEIISIWHTIEPAFNQAVLYLQTAVDSEIANDESAFKQNLENYIQQWQAIAEIVSTETDLAGLADVVLLFAEINEQTFTQQQSLNSDKFSLLNNWQTNFANYCKAPTDQKFAIRLVKCLRNPLWSEPIAAEDETMLLEALGIDESISIEDNIGSIVSSPTEATKHPVWQNIEIFFDNATSQIQVMLDLLATDNRQSCFSYLQQYVEQWTAIAEIISEHEQLQVLADLSHLFADNCLAWCEQKTEITQAHLQLLQTWHTNFAIYLQDITATPKATALINCLQDRYWIAPLTEQDKTLLLEMLQDENQKSPNSVAESENLSFDEELFAEQEDDFALFAEEEEQQESAESEVEQQDVEEISMFADETESAEDGLALFAEELEPEESLVIPQTARVSEEVLMMLAEEALEANIAKEADLFSEESINAPEQEQPIQQAVPVNPELIGMVRDEFALLIKELEAEISETQDTQAFKQVLKNHEFKFQNLSKACNTIGLLGLEQVFDQLSLNMRNRRDSDTFTEQQIELFKQTLPLIQNYIAAVTEYEKAEALVSHLSVAGWKQPLTQPQASSLLNLLSCLVLSSANQQLDNRKTVADAADVSLLLPEDVNRDLLDSLLNELPVLTSNFSTVIQKIISGQANEQQLREAQRIAHTLKGSGNIVGVPGIAVLTHHLEEILEYLTERKMLPPKALGAVLLEAADCLEMMSDFMLNGETHAPEQALQVLQNVLNWASQIATDGLPAKDAELEFTTLPTQPDTNITPVLHETKQLESVPMIRVSGEVIDKLMRMTGEGSILSEQFKERIKHFSDELKTLNELTWYMQLLVAELDQSINIQSYTAKKSGRSAVTDEFDALEMEQYNELHTSASRISEAATDVREIASRMEGQLLDLKYLMAEEDNIQKENQETVQSIRMVPANTITARCQRIVRQACRATNKEVELEIKGADLLIDSEILNDMVEPLMHLLRNSIDHGIEPIHIRKKFNKPKVGKITLEFSRKGNYAVITCKDDGGGLASGNILQTAIKKGLISAKQQLTEAEIHKLILIPGFSTRAVVTQTSGRGIGMDAIQTKISSMQGQMSLYSERGQGLTIEITIPLTLSSMLSLLVKCGGQTMAISNRGLRKIHHADECVLEEKDGQIFCKIDNQNYSFKYFAELVGMPINYSPEQKLPAVRIEDEIGRTHIVFVEELLGYRDLLVKDMGSYIPHIQGITGASILGNGAVAPVIDLVEMLHNSAKYDYVLADASKALVDGISGLPMALVVDDSLSARRSVAMLLKDSGFEVDTAIDGLDAIKHLEKSIPDIILVDLEMPRMNGIELTAHVRGRENMKKTPIIMITSRATEKHRKQAEAAGVTKFMTKPFTEDDLISSVRMLIK
jgi:chemosensory pili system protein ChpA (sensor histidine kinase/response regulator)